MSCFQSVYCSFISEILWTTIISLSKLSTTDVHLFNMRLPEAENAQFSLNECNLSNNLLKVLNRHATAIGVPQQFILWPLPSLLT